MDRADPLRDIPWSRANVSPGMGEGECLPHCYSGAFLGDGTDERGKTWIAKRQHVYQPVRPLLVSLPLQ